MQGQTDKTPPLEQASVQPQDTAQSQEGILTTQFWGKRKLSLQYITPAMNAVARKQGGGSSKGGGGGTAQYKWFADSMAVLSLGPITFVGSVWVDRVIVAGPNAYNNVGAEYFQFAVGNYGQCRFSWGNTWQNFPSFCNWSRLAPFGAQRGKARVEFQQFYFGSVGKTSMPTIEFECIKTPVFPGMGNLDSRLINFNYGANPIAIIYEILTNTFWGAGIPANQFDTSFIQTQITNLSAVYGWGMWLSPLYTSQQPIRSVINDLLQYFDGYIYRSNNGLIRIGFWPHQSAHTPVATFDMDKIVSKPRIKAPSFSSTANEIHITWTNSQNQYVTTVSRVGNPSQFYKTGAFRNLDLQREHITHPLTAYIFREDYNRMRSQPQNTGQIEVLKSAALTNNPADIVTVSLGDYGSSFLGRIKTWNYGDESKDSVAIEIEQELGTFDSTYVAPPDRESNVSLILVGPVGNSPKIVSLPGELRTGDLIEMGFLAERTEGFSYGFIPWISSDNSIFDSTSEFCFFAIRGSLQSVLNSSALSMSVLMTGVDTARVVSQTATQTANNTWLVFINDEICSLGIVTAVGGGSYNITMVRGLYGSVPVIHPVGTDVWFIAASDLTPVSWPPFNFGLLFYAKFQTLNHFNLLPLTTANSFSFVVGYNPISLFGPTNLTVGMNGNFTVFTWTPDPSPVTRGYQVRYGVVGGNWQTAKIADANAQDSQHAKCIIPPGTWTIYVASFDANGLFSFEIASVNFTVPIMFQLVEINYGPIERTVDPGTLQVLDWDQNNGSILVGCQVHPTAYVLVPSDTQLASFGTTGYELFEKFCQGFPTQCSFTSRVIDALVSNQTIRCSSSLFEYFYGLEGIPPSGLDLKHVFAPGWNTPSLSITGGIIHPTGYTITPQSTALANSTTGFDVFDNVVYLPVASTVVKWTDDSAAVYPSDLTLVSSVKQSAGSPPYKLTSLIEHSVDNVHWFTVSIGIDGTIKGSTFDRYARFTVTLDNTVGIASIASFATDTLIAPSVYFVPIPEQMNTSVDNITWSGWKNLASQFTASRYSKFMFSWNPNPPTSIPFSVESLWLFIDTPQNIDGGNNVTVPLAGLSIVFSRPYVQGIPLITVVPQDSTLTAIITVQSKSGYTVVLKNALSVSVAGIVDWSSVGT